MNHLKVKLLLTGAALCLSLPLNGGTVSTIVCLNKNTSGSWNFGSSPSGCNISSFQTVDFVKSHYNEVTFVDATATNGGRAGYVNEMYLLLTETGQYYIKQRNPAVTPAEEEGFVLALLTLASQESVWTHYRLGSDGVYRYMRGDSLHGFGLMQIDDRSHAVDIKAGKGEDLLENILYGLDIFYASWVKS